jgi:polar amino acid transport system substrate-binding protein
MSYKITFPTLLLLVLSCNSSAEKLKVAFGNTLAPWVMVASNDGILIELISEAMEPLGYEIEKIYYPYARRINSYQSQIVDVVCDINQKDINSSNLIGHFSGNVYAYENYAISLKKNNYHFSEIADLSQFSLMSWQGAREQLGSSYNLMAANNPSYIETHNQKTQVKMLFKDRVDVIQLDKQIFEFYRSKLVEEKEIDANIKVDQFALFGANPNGFLFRSVRARNDFVKQVELMKKDGRYKKIFNKYMLTVD